MSAAEVVEALRSLQGSLGAKTLSRRSTHNLIKSLKKPEQVLVHIKVIFLHVGDVDTVKETFEADVFIRAQWREPEFDGKDTKDEELDWDKRWKPNLYVSNSLGDPKEEIWYGTSVDEQKKTWAFEKRRLKGKFTEAMELETFPFDTQKLYIRLATDRPTREVLLEADPSEISLVRIQSFRDQQEWTLMKHVETWAHEGLNQMEAGHRHPVFFAACRVQRRSGYFMWNIFTVQIIITTLAFTSFAIDTATVQNRLLLTFTALLTTVAFKQIANRNMPRVSYLTYLDQYILTSMTLLTVIAVWHCIVKQLTYNVSLASTADITAVSILGAAFVIFQATFFLHVYFMARRERKMHNLEEEKYENIRKKQKYETHKKGQ